nr:YfjI family protein [Comamonas koreensis]
MNNPFGVKNYDDFPMDALPPLLRNTLLEVEQKIQSPIGLIASSMLSSMAIACQGAFNIRTPIGSVVPSSIFIITVAESGERKSTTDKYFTQPLRDFEEKRRKHHSEKLLSFKNQKRIWNINHQELEKILRKRIRDGEIDTKDLSDQLELMLENEPIAPLQMRLLYSDATSEALLENLARLWPSGAIHSSEASTVMSGRTLHKLGPINELWDGDSYIPVDRKRSESFELKNARLTISLMIQPQPLMEFLSKKKGEAIDIGLTSRFMITMPTSTQGYRKVERQDDVVESNSDTAFNSFKKILEYWLQTSENQTLDGVPHQEFTFNEDAGDEYLDILFQIENAIAPGGEFHQHSAIASKLGNNLARIAGLIQAFVNRDSSITLQTLSTASKVLYWYTNQHITFIKIFKNELTDEDMGDMLLEWLKNNPTRCGGPQFRISLLYKDAPNSIREKKNLHRAIDNLSQRALLIDNRNFSPMTISMNNQSFQNSNGFVAKDPFIRESGGWRRDFLKEILVSKFIKSSQKSEFTSSAVDFKAKYFKPGESGV